MKEIAVFGDAAFTLGFRLAGIRNAVDVKNPVEDLKELRRNKQVGIIIIDEQTMNALDTRTREDVVSSLDPVFVTVSMKDSQEELRKMILQSIGVDLQKENEE